MDQSVKQQIIDRLKTANNVLVTVSTNPSVDQLAACIGFTLLLNHLGKHGTAVFSGEVPSTIEFLKPEETLETNTNSLRDFIIALDKSKADKLRYKVEDKVVKIFITPYRTSLSQEDLEFSQGDFNVDVVLALGVKERQDLDSAITNHGRILHDATVISVNNHEQGDLGTINWVDLNASSLCEMLVDVSKGLTSDKMDTQMATAFMTGIVAETDRFSNDKTSPRTMTLSAELLGAGANQQLIASKLEPEVNLQKPAAAAPQAEAAEPASESADGSLKISHEEKQEEPVETEPDVAAEPEPEAEAVPSSTADEEPELKLPEPPKPKIGKARPTGEEPSHLQNASNMVLEPPTLGGRLTANSEPEHMHLDPSTDPLSTPSTLQHKILNREGDEPATSSVPISPPQPANQTLTNLEKNIGSPHAEPKPEPPAMPPKAPEVPQPKPEPTAPLKPEPPKPEPVIPVVPDTPEPSGPPAESVDDARQAVDQAIKAAGGDQTTLDPIEALGAQPVDLNLGHQSGQEPTVPSPQRDNTADQGDDKVPTGMPELPTMPFPGPMPPSPTQGPQLPPNLVPNKPPEDTSGNNGSSPTPPPPVPPPMTPFQ